MLLLAGYAPWWIIMILDGFFASGIVWLIHQLEEMMERVGVYYDPSDDNIDADIYG